MQRAKFPIGKTWESQRMNVGSHIDTKAIDFGVLVPYNDTKLMAPFDGKVVFVDSQAVGGGIAFESLEKVIYADGTVDYMTLWTGHDNKPPKVGDVFKQGEHYSDMGTAGGVDKHCHLEVQKGKFKRPTTLTSAGAYKIENSIEPFRALYINDDTIIKKTSYTWTKLPDTVGTPVKRNEYVDQLEVVATMLNARETATTSGKRLGYIEPGIYNILGKSTADGYTWYNVEPNMWIAYNEEWEILLPKKEDPEVLKKQIAELQKTNEQLNGEIKILKDKLRQINELSK